jgi:hypothetical protein
MLPTYNALGGPQGKGQLTFQRKDSDFLDAWDYQPRTFNIASSGGLTIVVIVRLGFGTFLPGERIIDFGNGSPEDNLVLSRGTSAGDLVFYAYNQNVPAIDKTCISVIKANKWLKVVVRYNATTLEYAITVSEHPITVNNALECGGVASTALTDRTLRWTRVGRSLGSDPYLNGDIAGLYVIDKFLSSAQASNISDAIMQGVDPTSGSDNVLNKIYL